MMRVLICGAVGAAASAAVWLGLEYWLQKDFGWLAIAVGLVTGWSVHKAAGSTVGGGYARGGLAALLALAAIVGGRQLYARVMEAVNDTASAVPVAAVVEEQPDESVEAVPTEETVSEVVEQRPIEDIGMRGAGGKKVSLKNRSAQMEMVWMCTAALAAYVIGRGRDTCPAAAEKIAEQTDEQPRGDSGQ